MRAVYDYKVEILGKLEQLSERGEIELIYADAARVSVNAVVPYGWQFPDEDVFMPSTQGAGLNCFAFLQRNNQAQCRVTRDGHQLAIYFRAVRAAFDWTEEIDRRSLG